MRKAAAFRMASRTLPQPASGRPVSAILFHTALPVFFQFHPVIIHPAYMILHIFQNLTVRSNNIRQKPRYDRLKSEQKQHCRQNQRLDVSASGSVKIKNQKPKADSCPAEKNNASDRYKKSTDL